MACRYTYQGKTYEAHEFDDVLRAMSPDVASKYMPVVTPVPSAPFVTNTQAWTALSLKRMIRYAAENGFDKVAWANGEQQAARYDLSKQMKSISAYRRKNGNFNLSGYSINNDKVDIGWDIPIEKVDDFVGKSLAQKIDEDLTSADQNKTYSDVDLKVGGEGMKGYYDRIVPSVANDVLKKLGGGRVGEVEIGGTSSYEQIVEAAKKTGLSQRELDAMPVFERESLVNKFLDKPAQQGFDITPKMRESVMSGQALFNRTKSEKLTPSDKAIYGMAAEGKSAKDILKFIAASSRNPFYRQLARVLLKTGIAPKITVGDGKGFTFNAGNDKKYAASYDPKTDTVALFRPASSERHVLHELVHAATIKALSKNGMAAVQMRALFNHAKATGKLDGMYGKENVDEFVAEAFSNPKFQEVLKQIAAPEGSARKTVWDRFISVIRGILGLKPISHNALSRALSLGLGVMHENMMLSEAAKDNSIRPQIAFHGTPHRGIEKFSTDKIGTGEGAQAYGHGLYFANKREVAEHYRTTLQNSAGATIDGVSYHGTTTRNDSGAYNWAASALKRFDYDKKAAIGWLDDFGDQGEARKILKKAKTVGPSDGGQLYEVEIPEDSEMLLWDKPLSEQPAKVREALTNAELFEGSANIGVEAADLLRNLSQRDAGSEQVFSKLDVPSQRLVLNGVRGMLNNLQVRQAVVQLVPVDVVNILAGEQPSSKMLLDNPTMLFDLFPPNRNDPVSVDVNSADAAIRSIALAARTEGFFVEADAVRVPKNLVAALRAGKLDKIHGDQIYKMAERELGSAQDASIFLKNVKVAGIKYLDGTSRKDGDGSYNYVIFSDQDVSINKVHYNVASDKNLTTKGNVGAGSATINVDGVERPRLNSNGKPIAQTDEGIRNFWKWFAGSKVTDDQGRPLVVYHGTKSAGFAVFDTGGRGKTEGTGSFFTTSPRGASTYSNTNSDAAVSDNPDFDPRYDGESGNYAVYLNIKTPDTLDAEDRNWDSIGSAQEWFAINEDGETVEYFTNEADANFYRDSSDEAIEIQESYDPDSGMSTDDYVRQAKDSGADGVIINNITDEGPHGQGYGWDRTIFVAFNPSQIKSATQNNGQFSPDNNDIRYNVASDWIDNNAPESVKSFVENAFASSKSTSLVTSFNTQFHKAQKWAAEGKVRFKKVFDLGQKFIGDTSRFGVMAQNAAPTLFHEIKSVGDVATALKGMKSLGDITGKNHTRDIEAIANPLYEGTLYGGGNPMAGVKFSDAKLKSAYGLTDRQIKLYHEALAAVNVSMDEMAKSIIAKHAKNEKVGFNSDLDIADMADGVIESLQEKQEDMRLAFDVEKQRYEGDIDDLRSQGKSAEAKKAERDFDRKQEAFDKKIERLDKTIADVQGIVDKNQKLQDHGYFPLMRFGENTVTAIDGEGNTQFFGMYEGNPLIPKSGQYQANKVANVIRSEHPEWKVTTGIQNTEKYKLYSGMNLEAVQLFAEHMDAETLEPFQEFLRLGTNNRSVMKRLIHREGTPGFDRDVRRTLSQFIVSNARSTSSNYHMFDMRKAAEDADLDGGDIGKEAVKLYKYVSEPAEEAHQLRGFLFFNFLGGSLASAAVNMSQVPMMTFPFLSKYMPAKRLASLLASSARMAVGDPSKMTGALGRALMQAELDGVTAPQEIHQMAATASNSIFSGSRGVNLLLRAWGAPFALAEAFNRRTTFIAAFKIAEKMSRADLLKTGSKSAFEFAENAVNETQGIYNKGNRPNIGRGAVGATLMTFKQFSIMYLELLKRLPHKQQLMMLGILLLAAGGGGLPFAEDIEDIIDTIGQWLGYSINSKKSIRHAATAVLGKTGADITINGLASQMGIDLHSRFGMQNLLPGTGALKQSSINKGRDIEEFFGPAGSVVQSLGSALGNLATGKVKQAALNIAPNAVANAAKGYTMLTTGYGEDSKGRKTLPANTLEGMSKFIGFNPKSFSNDSTIRNDLYQDRQLIQVKQEEFTSALVSAMLNKDPEARKKAMDDMREWNRNNPPEMRVTVRPSTILSRVRAAMTESPERFIKAMPKGMRPGAIAELRQ